MTASVLCKPSAMAEWRAGTNQYLKGQAAPCSAAGKGIFALKTSLSVIRKDAKGNDFVNEWKEACDNQSGGRCE